MNGKKNNLINEKEVYEPAVIELLAVQTEDIITTSIASGGFDGDADLF